MNIIETILLEIGIPANQRGFKYISDSIILAMSEDKYLYDTTTELYPEVARINNAKSPASAERCIRHAIETAFLRNRPDTIEKYFGNSIDQAKGKPTNAAFIATLALHLKEVGANDGTT